MTRLINVRGTHGSGKSTLVRNILTSLSHEPMVLSGRARPIGYRCQLTYDRVLVIPGHYETPSGGCDNISEVETAYSVVSSALESDHTVLFEGILAQHSTGRLVELAKKYHTLVVMLTTSLAECVSSVESRRAARGVSEPLNPRNVEREYKSVINSCAKLRTLGIQVVPASRGEALALIKKELEITCAE